MKTHCRARHLFCEPRVVGTTTLISVLSVVPFTRRWPSSVAVAKLKWLQSQKYLVSGNVFLPWQSMVNVLF